MEHRHQPPRKFVLRTTCLKNGGFRKYQPLPPQEVFQHAYWVLGSEMDVKIKRKQTLFNRETDWMFLPVYLTTNKGLLFVYVTNDAGYVLRISSALKLNFEGQKKAKKRQQTLGPNFTYHATIILQFHFGELHLHFNDCDENLRPWRAILLASHQSQNGVSKIAEYVGKEIFGSTSLESVVSTKSVYPEADDKDKTERVEIHRHAMIASNQSAAEEIGGGSATVSPTTVTTTSVGSSMLTKSVTKSPKCIKSISDVCDVSPYNPSDFDSFHLNDNFDIESSKYNHFENYEAGSNESLLDRGIASTTNGNNNPFSPSNKSSHLTSEVNVSFEDLDPLSVISNTAAFKTSPTQLSDDRFSRISTISTSSFFAGSNADKHMKENVLAVATPQHPIQQRPESLVEEIDAQFEPLKSKMLSESIKLQPQPLQQIQKVTFAKPPAGQQRPSLEAQPAPQLASSLFVAQPPVESQAFAPKTQEQLNVRVSSDQLSREVENHSNALISRELPGQDIPSCIIAPPTASSPHFAPPATAAAPSHESTKLQQVLSPLIVAPSAAAVSSRELPGYRQNSSPRFAAAPAISRGQQQHPQQHHALHTLSRRDQTTIPLIPPPRPQLPKPAQIGIQATSKPSKVLEFWRQKETQTAGQLPIHAVGTAAAGGHHPNNNVPINVRKVRFEEETLKTTTGKVINSPTKYYANIEDISESPSSVTSKFQSESHI